jgi:hypothetical protein
LSGCAFCNRCTLRATPCCSRWCCSTVASRYTPYVNKHVHCKGSLCRARWRQTLPARGLLEVRSRRHRALVMNLEFSILWPRRQIRQAGARLRDSCHERLLALTPGADTEHCAAHGGGRRCQHEGCPKPAATGGTLHCQAHGGGRRCQQEGCSKAVARGPGSTLCARSVCGPHSRSPTVRRRSNPLDTTCHSACANARRSSGWWRTSHKPVHG